MRFQKKKTSTVLSIYFKLKSVRRPENNPSILKQLTETPKFEFLNSCTKLKKNLMMETSLILQWNLNSFHSNSNELKQIIALKKTEIDLSPRNKTTTTSQPKDKEQ